MTDVVRKRLTPFRTAGSIPCVSAVGIAAECGAPTAAIGEAADRLGIRVTLCQLGLFGYDEYGEKRWVHRMTQVPKSLESEIRAVSDGARLSCTAAWELARGRGLPRLVVGCAAETLGIRIAHCQLGCFE